MVKRNQLVRLRNDPSQIGRVDCDEPVMLHGRALVWVECNGTRVRWPLTQLEVMDSKPSPIEDLRQRRLSAPEDLRRAITHARMTGKLADMIYSMGATNTEFHAYQFKPVIRLLSSPSKGLLIADEVGLGKTIESGLIWTELSARFECRKLLIVCPKSLVPKWVAELRSKFNLIPQVVDAADIIEILNDNGSGDRDLVMVASLTGLRPPRNWQTDDDGATTARKALAQRLRQSEDGLLDLVIFDEAHHLRNVNTTNHQIADLLVSVSDYKLFLSATPINLRSEDLRAILKLIDPETFGQPCVYDIMANESRPLIAACHAARNPNVPLSDVAALVRELEDGEILKTGQRLKRLRAELSSALDDSPNTRVRIASQLEEMSLLGSVVSRTRRRDVAELRVVRRPIHIKWEMNGLEREFYNTIGESIRNYALLHDINEHFLLAQSQRLVASSLAAAFRHWSQHATDLSLDEGVDLPQGTRALGPLIAHLAETCRGMSVLPQLEAEDTKFGRLQGLIRSAQAHQEGERLIIFSSFRRVIDYLAERMERLGQEVYVLHGGVKGERQTIIDRFRNGERNSILLTSEVGGEGLDLQFCKTVINWDLPWNPMKVEQRIGRVDRIGQKAPAIDIVSMVAGGTIEEVVFDRLYERLKIIEQALGDFEPILGTAVQDIEKALTNPRLTEAEKEEQIRLSALAAENIKLQTEKLEQEAPGLIAHGEAVLDRIRLAHEPHKMLLPSDISSYVASILLPKYPGTRLDRVEGDIEELHRLSLSHELRQALADFMREAGLTRYPTRLRRSDSQGVRVVFGSQPNPSVRGEVEAIPMNHPLARFAAHVRIREHGSSQPRPVVAFDIAGDPGWGRVRGPLLFVIQKWSFIGLNPVDRLVVAAAHIGTKRLLDEDTAERILVESLRAEPKIGDPSEQDLALAVDLHESVLLPYLQERQHDFEGEALARHEDLVRTQIAMVEREKESDRVKQMKVRIDNALRGGEEKGRRYATMERGRLDKLMAKLNKRLEDLKAKEQAYTIPEPDTIGVALINVLE